MPTLSDERRKKLKRNKFRLIGCEMIASLFMTPYISSYLDALLINKFDFRNIHIEYLRSFLTLFTNRKQLMLFGILEAAILLLIFYLSYSGNVKLKPTDTMQVTDRIKIPVSVGQGQHGNARFMTEKEKDKSFEKLILEKKDIEVKGNVGIILGMVRDGAREVIHCIAKDINTIIIGATRSGKTRRLLFVTVWLRALAGKSMVITDVKGEVFMYTKKFLERLNYNIIDFDLIEQLKSKRHNYMIKINEAVDKGDIPKAIDLTWDFVSVLVGVPKGDPLWTNGESATIAAGILAVATQAEKQYRNLTNVYMFLAKMCKPDENGRMPITSYFETLPDNHPAKSVFDIAEISPEKMRGSFFGMALTTLRLFTNWNIADLTSESDFDLEDIGKRKTALFIIVQDEKKTFYPLVSLFVSQIYTSLIDVSRKSGGKLPVEVDFYLEEIGNFPEIPGLGTMISAGLSRGIRFVLVIQDFQQLEKRYKEDFGNIKANCLLKIYLKTTDYKTQKELSDLTGTYTVETNSLNSSSSGRKDSSSISSGVNMASRPLLNTEEIGLIQSPYCLVFYSGEKAMFHTPDLAEYRANEVFGLGNEEHNCKVYMDRNAERTERKLSEMKLWGIWENYDEKPHNDFEKEAQPKQERAVSFLK